MERNLLVAIMNDKRIFLQEEPRPLETWCSKRIYTEEATTDPQSSPLVF